MIEMYAVLSIPFGWMFISKLQRNFTIFTTISNYVVYKIILSLFLGWIVTPFYIIGFLFKFIGLFSSSSSDK